MTTKHQPATPLPFKAGTSTSKGLNKILDADGHVVGEASHYSVNCFEQRDYLIHAANAYPKLVEALKSGIASLEQFVNINRIPANNQGLRDMRAALAELGEPDEGNQRPAKPTKETP